MQRQTVLSDSGFPKYSWAHVVIFNTTAWRFLMQCHLKAQRSCTFNWGFLPCPTQTEISLDSLNLFTILCMVVGERPQFFAILHWEIVLEFWNWGCMLGLVYHSSKTFCTKQYFCKDQPKCQQTASGLSFKWMRHTDIILGASFTKRGKLAQERNSKTAPMGMEISARDLLTSGKLKNTDAILFPYRPTQYTKHCAN